MAEKLCALRKKGGGGQQYTETSLWTNSSPTSDFAGQDVTLSESFDNYKYVKVRYKLSKTNNTEAALIVTSDDLKKSLGGDNQINMNFGGRTTTTRDRIVRYINSTTLTITVAYHLNGTTTSTSDLIPLEILGLNELDHGKNFDETILWTNNAPTSSYAGGSSVSLSQDIDNFDYIKVNYRLSTTDSTEASVLMSVADIKNSIASNNHNIMMFFSRPNAASYYGRYVSYSSDTSLIISPAYQWNTTSTNNNCAIPLSIVGCKFR